MYLESLKASKILDKPEAVSKERFNSKFISQSVIKSSLNSGAISKILATLIPFFSVTDLYDFNCLETVLNLL